MSTGPWPAEILRLLADVSAAVDAAYDRDEKLLGDYLLGITVTSHGDHIGTLYEEGWDFSTPKPVAKEA